MSEQKPKRQRNWFNWNKCYKIIIRWNEIEFKTECRNYITHFIKEREIVKKYRELKNNSRIENKNSTIKEIGLKVKR